MQRLQRDMKSAGCVTCLFLFPFQNKTPTSYRKVSNDRSQIARKRWSTPKFELSVPWVLGLGVIGANMGGKLFFALQFEVPYHFN